MTFSVVGSRAGRPVIRWTGVVASALIITAVYSMPIAGFYWGVGFFSSASFVLLPAFLAGIIGTSILRGLRRSPEDLPTVA
jgi:hypothetical protein